VRLLASLAISALIDVRTCSIPVFRFQFLVAGTLEYNISPVVPSTHVMCTRLTNRTLGGTAG
jgi:hypothetical protein